jgi:hypothetical protein
MNLRKLQRKKKKKKLKKKKNLLKKLKQRKLQLVKNPKINLQVVDVVVGIQMKMKRRNLIQQNHQIKVQKITFCSLQTAMLLHLLLYSRSYR